MSSGRRVGPVAGASVLVLAIVAWLLWQGGLGYRVPPPLGTVPSGGMAAWRGAVHVHTRLSGDARGSAEAVASAAQRAGLDFVVITEHTRAQTVGNHRQRGWFGNVLLIAGEEISTRAGHLLALDIPAHAYAVGPTARQAVDDIVRLGGHALVAHPLGGELAWSGPWSGVAGLEVVSWPDALHHLSLARRIALAPSLLFNPAAAARVAFRRANTALALWDEQTRSSGANARPLAALAAVDAHGPVPVLGVPTYESLFRTLTMVVPMQEPPAPGTAPRAQARAILERLAAGRAHIEVSALGSAPAFRFRGRSASGRAVPGDIVDGDQEWTLEASVGEPGPYRIVLLADGKPATESTGEALRYVTRSAATYRVEVLRTDRGADDVPWIISNPIYVWPPTRKLAAVIHRVPPLPAPPVSVDLLTSPGWTPERDESSFSAIGIGERGLLWKLRLPLRRTARAYAALAWRPEQHPDWSAARGVAVVLRAQQRWKVALRLWTRDPEGGVRTWERIVAADPAGRGTGVRWRDFQLLQDHDTAPGATLTAEAVGEVTGLALVVTPDQMKPGTETDIELLGIGPFGLPSPRLVAGK